MQTPVLSIDPVVPDPVLIEQAARIVRDGGLVAFPTETVYGLGANALNPLAVANIFAAKGRPANNPLIVHVADISAVPAVAAIWPDKAARLAARFWPGPLTLVLPKCKDLPAVVTAGGPTVAVRVPAHAVARALIQAAGVPIAAPSANRSSLLSPTRAKHVLRSLGGRIHMILDGGPCAGGLESTVLDLTSTPPRLLRPGLITPTEIETIIGPIQQGSVSASSKEPSLPSPGMLHRHYAPRAPLECVAEGDRSRVVALRDGGQRIGWLTFAKESEADWPGVAIVRMPRDPAIYAARLYAALHALDEAGVERILVTLPPDLPEWLAVHDRLRRASADA